MVYNEIARRSDFLRGGALCFMSVLQICGAVRSGQVVETGQWSHDAGSHSFRDTQQESVPQFQ